MADIKSNKKETRTRTWCIVVYPDSAPDNWRELLDQLQVEWIESPLHDKDINPDGTLKKPHWHVLLMFGGVKSYEQVVEITESIHAPIPQRCHNAKAAVRYMAHLDHADKVKYSVADIKGHCGADVSEMLRPSSSERYTIIGEMINFLREQRIVEFQDIVDYSMANRYEDWYPLLADNSTLIIDKYIKSQRHRVSQKIDYTTGEVFENAKIRKVNDEYYVVYRMNKFNDNLTDELVANFYDVELAKNFCNYQATLDSYCYAVFQQDICVYNPSVD
jgi:hypothetical protein